MIKVGINENVFIADAKIVTAENDATKSRLVIDIKEKSEDAEAETELPKASGGLDDFNSSEEEGLESSGLSIFPFDNKVDADKEFTIEMAKQRIAEVKDPLNHILLGYKTKAEIKWDIFKGIPITPENSTNMLLQQDVLLKIYNNIVGQFIEMIKPHLPAKKAFRFLAVRQSAKKHYPAFRKRFLKDQPFWESMDIPKEQSKLSFSNYEISKGLNNGIPLPTDDTAKDSSEGSAGISAGIGLGSREA